MVERRLQTHRNILNERKRIEEQEDKDKDEIILAQIAARNRMDCLVKKKKKEVFVYKITQPSTYFMWVVLFQLVPVVIIFFSK